MNKKVSIIIPCYNQGEYVKESIESALAQTYRDLEIIVVDDASSDNSSEIIEKYTNKFENIKFIQNSKNKGASYSRNIAIKNATGKYILPLDADDKIDPTYVEKAVEVFDKNPDMGIVYCNAELFGTQEGKWELKEFNKDKFLFENCIFCSALFKKEVWKKAGKYNETMKSGYEDWDLWISILELGYEVYKIPETLFYYRKHGHTSLTSDVMENLNTVRKQIFTNHIEFYLQNNETYTRLFDYVSKDTLNKANSKLKRYRKLFRIFLIISIVLAILLLGTSVTFYILGK